ncbi:stimulated by retinoic acid gene 6 protein-like [Clarias gariepinus]|uniref:stimulated by retinoic acid gene 6 protein-like n=1 Tax=Clarias gariepinus TaxID=13013 RepID=UPI00234D145E|nr:stimulated by retinoic acid gene 6 protein-like [Clarias gariepinus]
MDNDSFTDFIPVDENSTDISNETIIKPECENYDQNFLNVTLIPAAVIILLLALVERRKRTCACERKVPCLSGRFGVVVPVDFTSTTDTRWFFALVFGSVVQNMVSLILGITNPLPFTLPSYLSVFVYMLAALKVGIACMPLFACLSTPHQLLGGVLGLLYSIFWFIVQLLELLWCSNSTADKGGLKAFFQDYEWLLDVPQLLCLGLLMCRFGFQMVKDVLIRLKKLKRQEEVKKEQLDYVKRLLRRPSERSVQKSWFQRKVYEWDPYFKFPNRMITTVVLSFFSLYLMVLLEQVITFYFVTLSSELYDEYLSVLLNQTVFIQHLNYAKYTWYVSSGCGTFSSVIHIILVLVFYRKHIKSVWAGEKKYLPRKYNPTPAVSLCGLLKYPGFQIAFTLWGYLLVHLAMFVGGMAFVYLVIYPIQTKGFLPWLINLMIVMANFFIMLVVMTLQRLFIHIFFLQDKKSPLDKEKPLALDNRKIFHNLNYFLFFFNMILGLMSCVMRVLKSAVVGLMLLPRIERALMPQGFQKFDASYCTWVGMIIADHHHSNPVLICFCHLLQKHSLQCDPADETLKNSEPPVQLRVRTRWLLMYTLVRNPKLITMRKKTEKNEKDADLTFAMAVLNTS